MTKTSPSADINAGSASNAFDIHARAGSTTGNTGDGGEIRLSAGHDLLIDFAHMDVTTRSSSGAGGKYILAAGTGGTADDQMFQRPALTAFDAAPASSLLPLNSD